MTEVLQLLSENRVSIEKVHVFLNIIEDYVNVYQLIESPDAALSP